MTVEPSRPPLFLRQAVMLLAVLDRLLGVEENGWDSSHYRWEQLRSTRSCLVVLVSTSEIPAILSTRKTSAIITTLGM